jgi:hypothetical protein
MLVLARVETRFQNGVTTYCIFIRILPIVSCLKEVHVPGDHVPALSSTNHFLLVPAAVKSFLQRTPGQLNIEGRF